MTTGKTIAIVDDDAIWLRALRRFLLAQGYQVAHFSDPVEALLTLPTLKIDLVIMDFSMPGLDGVTLTKKLQDFLDQPPVFVLVSANLADIPDHEQQAFSATFMKPVSLNSLVARVRTLLSQAHRSGTRLRKKPRRMKTFPKLKIKDGD